MECDLGRLHIAIKAANDRLSEQNRFLAHLAGFKVKEAAQEPEPAPETPEALDEKFRVALAALGGVRVSLPPPAPE